jgi:hypothetical protein
MKRRSTWYFKEKSLTFRYRGDHFRFDSVFIKKNNQTEFFKKKTETGSNRPVLVRFGFLETKTRSNRFGSVFRFDSVFC